MKFVWCDGDPYCRDRRGVLGAAVGLFALLAVGSSCLTLHAQTIRANQTIAPTTGAALAFTMTDGAFTCNGGACPTGTAVALNSALLTVATNPINWFDDGTAPTAGTGHNAPAGTTITLGGHNALVNFKAIGVGGTASVVGSFGRP
jgi:hypothetical protein